MNTTKLTTMRLNLAIAVCGLAFLATGAWSQTAGDFRSVATGDWDSTGTWERYNGTTWVTDFYPTNQNAGAVTVQSGHSEHLIF